MSDFVPPSEPDWGYIDPDGVFRPVVKGTMQLAELTPPCTVELFFGPREIILDPDYGG